MSLIVINSGGSKGGGATGAPLKFDKLWVCFFPIRLSECLKNKAQITRESIKITPELPGPLSGPWTPPKVSSFPRL